MNLLSILASQSENSTPRAIPGTGQDPGRQHRSLQKFSNEETQSAEIPENRTLQYHYCPGGWGRREGSSAIRVQLELELKGVPFLRGSPQKTCSREKARKK